MNAEDLIEFETEVAAAFEAGHIDGPVHLNSATQAKPLIEIFKDIKREDYVCSTWRSHWHALLHGVPRDQVMIEILAGCSMMLHFPEYRFMSSAIVGGMLPIACGLAAGGERVWCFVGDMCATTGAFADACRLAAARSLNIKFVIEDNGLSTNTPTKLAWGPKESYQANTHRYLYTRQCPHYQPLPNQRGF